jgi:acetyl-CoA acetyltransferase
VSANRYLGQRIGERDAVISGIGRSAVGRKLGRTGLSLTVESALAAIEDAGLSRDDIDGLATYPGMMDASPGMSPCGVNDVQDALRLKLNWFSGGGEVPAQLGAVFNAVAAVCAGLANHVLVFRTVTESSAQTAERRASVVGSGGSRVGGSMQWMVPFHAVSAANWVGIYAQRYMHDYGLTRTQLGQIPLNQRRHAALYDKAIFRDPLTMDDYLNARMVSYPLGLYDCDIPCDGSCAVVVSRADAAPDLKQVVRIEAIGSALTGRNSWDQRADLTETAAHDCTKMMWARTDLTVDDVDTIQLYDGFSFLTVTWLEALGFFPKGEAGPWLEGGEARIGLGGQVPLNTNGGQLSGGRLHGYGYLYEACTQLRGEAAGRQVAGAEVAVVGAGGGPLGGCMLLTKDR